MLTVLRVVYAIVRLSSGKTMVSILHQTYRGLYPCHGSNMKNQYLFLEFKHRAKPSMYDKFPDEDSSL